MLSVLAERFSPYAFDPEKAVPEGDLEALFEAARWTMSSYNAQPWRYLVGVRGKDDRWEKIHACLVEGNQPWTANAPVLVLGFVRDNFDFNGQPNIAAEHDLGAASAMLTVEATARGLAVHQMIGVDLDKVVAAFDLPEGTRPLTALAIGYHGSADVVPEAYAERDAKPRERLSAADILL
ncbi:nitroreductase [Mangrovimicrobium sediminis]|uniref:Nitroreductase n=1 Tax=Mangrovimicrobium sediminis TaxID=2562682 RepID=A0A4Z0M1D9_9GAMM|nr:nitroreductase [Haliea sp. SAOS-164]